MWHKPTQKKTDCGVDAGAHNCTSWAKKMLMDARASSKKKIPQQTAKKLQKILKDQHTNKTGNSPTADFYTP